jgi:hypothetical protein
MAKSGVKYPTPNPTYRGPLHIFTYYYISHAPVYSYLMGVDAIDQTICPEVLGMTKCSIA